MEPNKATDFKSNVADLTKIPPNEFEKYFQEWMERDDVARSLQAKLRCDLIKNFNKTNLGKHILSHSMTSSGGSTLRLTLSPLVLALNTLVAEFLYAQNCHFTLSVFCTEIPFRNTLPDFESMRRFRFNNEEIFEIWQAVTGSKSNKRDLNKNIIQNYETNPNISLLLLIIKCLVKKDPLEQLKRNAEVQTEFQEKVYKSISAQASDPDRKSSSKATAKDDNLHYINKYLLILSAKVVEMTREFEEFAKQRREARPRNLRSSRSREYYTLNKSLERITENMKAMVLAKRKNKRLSIIVESIDNLTQQFGKCAQNFDNVTKVLGSKVDKPASEKPTPAKVKLKEKQTETELQEKSYADWIHEMRNTENGKKFLSRVEISLRKALSQHREQLQHETDIKIKNLKCLLKLHYQHKLSKHLLQNPALNLEDAHKCNENIEKKLQQFERKQMELLQTLQESSLELKEVQLQQKKSSKLTEDEKFSEKEGTISPDKLLRGDSTNPSQHEINLRERPNNDADCRENNSNTVLKTREVNNGKSSQSSVRDVPKGQEQIVGIAQTIAEQGSSVDRIICDAKLRIQQLENESNQLEKNFQSYLERRKRSQEQDNIYKKIPEICSDLKDLYQVTNARILQERRKPACDDNEQDEQIEEEFHRLKETLQQIHESTNVKEKSAKSESSTSSLEIRNAILEAKLKFFEHEHTIRKCREQGEEIRSGNFLQKQLEKLSEIPDYFNHYFEQCQFQNNIHFETQTDCKDIPECITDPVLSELNIKHKPVDEQQDIDVSGMKPQKIEEKMPMGVRRELFRIDMIQNEKGTLQNTLPVHDAHNYLSYHEPGTTPGKNQEQYSKEEKINQKSKKKTDTTSKLIKQSMAKMQQLFEQQSKSQDTLREMVNELQQEKDFKREEEQTTNKMGLRPNEALEKSLTTTTMTSITTTTSNTTKTSEETEMKNTPKMFESMTSLNRISYTSMPSLSNSTSDSENSIDSNHQQNESTPDIIKETDCSPTSKEEKKIVLTNIKQQQEPTRVREYFEAGELHSPPAPNIEYQEPEPNLQLEFGQLNDSPKLSDLHITSPDSDKEIGEICKESNRTFAPIDGKLGDSFSSLSSTDFEISTGHQNNDARNLADDSESDFWA